LLDTAAGKRFRGGVESPLVLASKSPRRSALLREAGVAFEIADVSVDEFTPATAPQLGPAMLAEMNADLKASAAIFPGRWTLGADTVVARDGCIFGKPANLEEAREFLRALSGGAHEVVTGCALLGPGGQKMIFHETTRVVFHVLSDETIARYLAEVSVLDKAGGYGLQDRGEMLVESVEGSRANVIGLPIERLLPLLRERGLV
jgi:septum formation protein